MNTEEEDQSAHVAGFITFSGSIPELRAMIRDAGLTPSKADSHHIHIEEFSHVMLREYSKFEYMIEADADTPDEMVEDMKRFSSALSAERIGYNYEIYDSSNELVCQKEEKF
ncbi:MAG: hypothetical protein AAGA18_06250 [Verrucomicrobiota bacterium]